MKCRVCAKPLAEQQREWGFAVWIENRLFVGSTPVCAEHQPQRACELCLESANDLNRVLCRLCEEFAARRSRED